MRRETFPVAQMTYDTARQIAVDFMGRKPETHHGMANWLKSGESHGSPDGLTVGLSQYVFFAGDTAPAYRSRHHEIVVYWDHDPERRIYVFDAFQLWDEVIGRAPVQEAMF